MIVLAVPTYGRVSTAWAQNFHHFANPLGSVSVDMFDARRGVNIAEKRNGLIQRAIDANADTLIFLSDDVIPPNNFILTLLAHQRRGYKAVTGVYWTKQHPPQPYIFKGYLQGPYYDWKAGEFIQVDMAGCDCLMLDVKMLREIGSPWFSLDYTLLAPKFTEGTPEAADEKKRQSETCTEDFFFFTKLHRAGIALWCDTSIQCLHEDRETGIAWGMTKDFPQYPGVVIPEKGLLIADIGCGNTPNPLAQSNKVLRYDSDESVKPDIRCDVRSIPEPDETFDIAFASHILEHIPIAETSATLKEWLRIVKIGGKLIVRVPDIAYACKRILGQAPVQIENPAGWPMPYHHHMIYGLQVGNGQTHFNGFTAENLEATARSLFPTATITLEKSNPDLAGEMTELTLTVVKEKSEQPAKLYDGWKQ